MNKENISEKLDKLVTEILVNDKTRNAKIQEFIELFVDNFNENLSHNATPLSNLVKGLKRLTQNLSKHTLQALQMLNCI